MLEEMVRSRTPEALAKISDQDAARNSLYICGSPGIGKTTAVNWCAEHLIEMNSSEQFLGDGIDLAVVNINCSQFASGGSNLKTVFFDTVWAECNPGRHLKRDAEEALLRSLQTTSGNEIKKCLILVLDEVDQLVDPTSESKYAKVGGEKLLRDLCHWTMATSKLRFAMVGIGNAMNNNKFRRVDHFAQVSPFMLCLMFLLI